MKNYHYVILWFLVLLKNGKTETRRIFGGHTAESGQFPYFAQLRITFPYNKTNTLIADCGGSLILPDWIISAGHCFLYQNQLNHTVNWTEAMVFVGTHLTCISDISNCDNDTINYVSNVVIHKDYYKNNLLTYGIYQNNDIAVAKLQKKYVLSKLVQLILLPPLWSEKSTRCENGTIVGIGWINMAGERNPFVKYLKITSESSLEEQLRYPTKFLGMNFLKGSHPYKGDTGSPFICDFDGNAVIFGIMSSLIEFNSTEDCEFREYVMQLYEDVEKQMKFILDEVPNATTQIFGGLPKPAQKNPSDVNTLHSIILTFSIWCIYVVDFHAIKEC